MKKKNKNRNSGFAMALVLLAIVLLLLLGGSLLGLSQNAEITSIRRSQEIAAKCAADAGITKALFDLNVLYTDSSLDLDNLLPQPAIDLENSDAQFEYNVYLDVGNITVDSTGTSGPCVKTVHCTIQVYSSIFEHPFFASKFDIGNSIIDGYNSNYGLYGGLNISPISIATNNTDTDSIKLANGGSLNGDIYVGPDGSPLDVIDKKQNFDVTGSFETLEEEKNIPVILPPSLTYEDAKASGTITDSGQYGEIISSANNEVVITIEGDVTLHITGNVELDNGATIEITEGSSLTLFIDGAFKMLNGGKINNSTKKPPNCKIYSTHDDPETPVEYNLSNTGEFYGSLYTPNANVHINENVLIYGAIIANELIIDNSSEVYGDKALLEGIYGDDNTKLIIGNWWE